MIDPWNNHVVVTAYNDICSICSPLKMIAIDGFFFMRFFPDGKYIDLATDLQWTDHFFRNYYQGRYNFKTVKSHLMVEKHIDIWSLTSNNQFFQDAQQYFNIKDGITISYPQKSWQDIFCYYINVGNKLEVSDLINFIDSLRKFADYFLEKAHPILEIGKESPLMVPFQYKQAFFGREPKYANFQKLLDNLSGENKVFYKGFSSLTPQEIRCIQYAKNGLSAIEIADKLKVSRRTVESYLVNARVKTNCKNLIELVFRYQEAISLL